MAQQPVPQQQAYTYNPAQAAVNTASPAAMMAYQPPQMQVQQPLLAMPQVCARARVCVCVCVCVYRYVYRYIHTGGYRYIYRYIHTGGLPAAAGMYVSLYRWSTTRLNTSDAAAADAGASVLVLLYV